MDKKRVIVSGAAGQVGSAICKVLCNNMHLELFAFQKSTLDISNPTDVFNAVKNIQPDYFINAAAYTAVDKAEQDASICNAINITGCTNISNALSKHGGKLIHFSSDYVYNTFSGFPIKEDNELRPNGIYAKSKAEGEQQIRASGIPALILRTSWVYSETGSNFVHTMRRIAKERPQIRVVNDQFGAPTYAPDIAMLISEIIEKNIKNTIPDSLFNSTFNYCNQGIVTWYDFAVQILKLSRISAEVIAISSTSYPTLAPRPHWSVMDLRKIKQTFHTEIPHWLHSLNTCINNIENQIQ
jgi:dTDP-4-dehydrorhamnose reductase